MVTDYNWYREKEFNLSDDGKARDFPKQSNVRVQKNWKRYYWTLTFYMVPKDLLLKKLESNGIRSTSLKWFESYLRDKDVKG